METVCVGSGNIHKYNLTLGGQPYDLSSETRFVIDADGVVLDSSVTPTRLIGTQTPWCSK